ncbi:MAG: fibronectin type III domain-containing protein [Acidobacteriota bacterium]
MNLSNLQTLLLGGDLVTDGNQLGGTIPASLGNLPNLAWLDLRHNQLSGSIPDSLGSSNLQLLFLSHNKLIGSIPESLKNLSNLRVLELASNQLIGTIPSSLGNLSKLEELQLGDNQLTGTIPASLGGLSNLTFLTLFSNQLIGSIPDSLGNLSKLQFLALFSNQLSGTIPDSLGNLSKLLLLALNSNQLSGSIPDSFGKLSSLQFLLLGRSIPAALNAVGAINPNSNLLSGSIPPSLGNLTNLQYLYLDGNRLSGSIPASLGGLASLKELRLDSNALISDLPASLASLSAVTTLNLSYNGLFATNSAAKAWADARQAGWNTTQTVAPRDLGITSTAPSSATLAWTPIAYTSDAGFYRVLYSTTAGGPYTPFAATTPNKSSSSLTVTGLAANTKYYFVVQTTTSPHALNANVVTSETSTEVSATTLAATPAVVVSALPAGMLGSPGTAGSTDQVSFTNVGSSSATITLTQSGNFFSIAPSTLSIAAGETRTVTITATPQPAGNYEGTITASGSGIQDTLVVSVRLLVANPPQGSVVPLPQTYRVDVTEPAGSVQITNSGSATLQGILLSDVPWLIPQAGVITIPSGQTVTVTFSIDRSKRPDAESLLGAVTGNLTLMYLEQSTSGATAGMIQALGNTSATASIKVVVVDLVTPSTSMSAIPPLASGEIALFLPGLGKKATLVSDVTMLNSTASPIAGLKLFFAASGVPTTSVQQALIGSLGPLAKALFSDLLKGVFNRPDGQVGGVQVRGANAAQVNLAALLTNPINPAGLFSGSVASQRSDRGVGANGKTVLTGIRKDLGAHTDLYVQEVAGQAGSVRTDFLGEDGTVRKTRTDTIGAFAILEFADEAPSGAVSASVTNLGPGSRIVAQALVFDEATGDPTNLVDWNQRNGTADSELQIIPLAASGVTAGKRTRTDVWITNRGTTTATGTLAFHRSTTRSRPVRRSSTEPVEAPKTITVDAGKTRILRDVIASEFLSSMASGYLLYTPASGTVAITSGTFKDAADAQPGASGGSGTGVPVMAASTGLKVGERRQFGSLEDASTRTIAKAEPATYRTGFGLVESSGKSVIVKVTLRYFVLVPRSAVSAQITASKEYALAPRGSIFVDRMSPAIFGPDREQIGDMHDLILEIAVTGGEGQAIPFTLATENGSGDTILRIE